MKKIDFGKVIKSVHTFWGTPPKGKFLNLKEILCLGTASLGISFICNIISIYINTSQLPVLYNMGADGLLHATIMYIVAYGLGMVLTPIYGKMLQKTKSKFGRYKPYLLFLAPVVSLFAILASWSPQGLIVSELIDSEIQTFNIIYMYLVCTPTILVWNLWYNTFNMFPGVFTPNQQERADIWSPIGLVMGFAPTIMNALRGVFERAWGTVVAARAFSIASVLIGLICVVLLIRVKERVFITEEENKKESIPIWKSLKMVLKNKPLMILSAAMILGSLKGTIDGAYDLIGRVKYATEVGDAVAIMGGLSLFVGFAATPNMILLPWLTRKFNNKTILMFWQLCNILGLAVFSIVGFQNFEQSAGTAAIITVIRFVATFNALGSLQPLMISEIGDYQQNKTGYRLDGFIQTMMYSVVTFISNLFMLVPAFIQKSMNINLNDYSVPEGGINRLSEELISRADGYFNIVTYISLASSILMFICLIFYPLSKKKHAQIVEELKGKAINSDEILSEQGNKVLFDVLVDGDANKDNQANDAAETLETDIDSNDDASINTEDSGESNDANSDNAEISGAASESTEVENKE